MIHHEYNNYNNNYNNTTTRTCACAREVRPVNYLQVNAVAGPCACACAREVMA